MIEFLNTGKTLTRSGAQERTVGAALRGRLVCARDSRSDGLGFGEPDQNHGRPRRAAPTVRSAIFKGGLVKQLRRSLDEFRR